MVREHWASVTVSRNLLAYPDLPTAGFMEGRAHLEVSAFDLVELSPLRGCPCTWQGLLATLIRMSG